MKDEYYKLFGLEPGAPVRDVKKAYRALAKQNHPDRFTDPEKKKAQEKRMAAINDAYQVIQKEKEHGPAAGRKTENKPETDTSLYKKGAEIYSRLNISIAIKFGTKEYDMKTVRDKIELAGKAKEYFITLLKKFTDSDWAYDSEEKMKDIPKYIQALEENAAFLATHKIGTTKKGTPVWKKKDGDK